MVTKINIEITTNVVAITTMPISNFIQEDLTIVLPSPNVIKKFNNVDCSIFYNYNNQYDSFEPCNEHDDDNSSSFAKIQ